MNKAISIAILLAGGTTLFFIWKNYQKKSNASRTPANAGIPLTINPVTGAPRTPGLRLDTLTLDQLG